MLKRHCAPGTRVIASRYPVASLVTAHLQGGALDWQLTDTVLKSDTDTEVIPTREALTRAATAAPAQGFDDMQKACRAHWQTGR